MKDREAIRAYVESTDRAFLRGFWVGVAFSALLSLAALGAWLLLA